MTKPPEEPESYIPEERWIFGSHSGTQLDSREFEKTFAPINRDFISFDQRLRSFITSNFPGEAPRYEDLIYIQPFKCLYISYQSVEDWTEARDILRCNPDFHECKRYDCVIVNDDGPGTTVARLHLLLRCWLPSGKVVDMALVHAFNRNKWRPFTMWDNCQIYTETQDSSFLLMDYVV
ncbi:hypothetical protein CVT25_008074 [Psilocybe cyanescens]|uniref:Uncharacterized protein n=1 Tax=Psilocybe cyanescens TaxID=93625 RepID=A0A409X6W2_PSICY|nr:hypothetical protein CVT25_008074 [Psilocybe cyanescens]